MLPASSSRICARSAASPAPGGPARPRSTMCAAHTAIPRVQQRAVRQALDGGHPARIALPGGDQARVDDLAVEDHGARAALALAAALLGAGQPEILAQHVEQPLPRRHIDRARLAVDLERHLHGASQRGRLAAIASGEIGSASNAQPSASSTALATAAAGPSIGISPTPLAPLGPNGYGTSTRMVSSSGASANVGTMQLVMFALATLPSLYTTFSSSAQPSACSVPPSIWPRTIAGLIALPTSITCTQRATATSQVSRSISTSTRHAAQPYTGYADPV